MSCKTESYFLIMFSMVGRIWIRDGPHAGHGLRTTALNATLTFIQYVTRVFAPSLSVH